MFMHITPKSLANPYHPIFILLMDMPAFLGMLAKAPTQAMGQGTWAHGTKDPKPMGPRTHGPIGSKGRSNNNGIITTC